MPIPITRANERAAREAAEMIARRRHGYSLEAPFYTSEDIFALDLEAIWARHWIHAGVEADVPEPGDVVAIDIDRYPILIVRGLDGAIRAFHNVCRHRGARIVTTPRASVPKLVCGYHQWSYDFTGALSFAEHLAPGLDRSCLGLKPVHIRNLSGLLFLCLAEEPPEGIDAVAEALAPYLDPHELRNARIARQDDVIMQANWKAVMENNRECYHCNGHPELLRIFFQFFAHSENDVKPRQKAYYERFRRISAEMHDIWNGNGLPWRVVEQLDSRPTPFRIERMPLDNAGESYTMDTRIACRRLMGSLTEKRLGALSLHTQPNSWNHFLSDHAVVFDILPLSASQTLLRTKWLVHKEAVEGKDYDPARLTEVWRTTNSQDATFVSWQQQGATSPAYEPGPYSPNEGHVEKFIDWYMDRLALAVGDGP